MPSRIFFPFGQILPLQPMTEEESALKQYRSLTALTLTLALAIVFATPGAALFGWGGSGSEETPTVAAFSKNGLSAQPISFSQEDFVLSTGSKVTLDSIVIAQLPDETAGTLAMGNTPLSVGDSIAMSAISGLRFLAADAGGEGHAMFTFSPLFSDGTAGETVAVDLYLLAEENLAPIAENLTFTTYRDVAYTGEFDAMDPDGDLLTFRLVDKPARGSVTLSEDGTGTFVYTPYEGKTGKDSFTYVAVDEVGNTSPEAQVTLRIQKPDTAVTYADMDGHPAYNAALRLAEEGLFVGQQLGGQYFFQPDSQVSRAEFLSLVMSVTGDEPLEDVSLTGFADDDTIPTWAKGYAASALQTGLVGGQLTPEGDVVFQPDASITRAEAAVILDRALKVSDVSVETAVYADSGSAPAWAYQSAVNLETVGVLDTDAAGALVLEETVTRGDAAQMLVSALEVLEVREHSGGWFA